MKLHVINVRQRAFSGLAHMYHQISDVKNREYKMDREG